MAEHRVDGRVKVLGVLNVTPDSFSDGGRFLDAGAAIQRGHALTDAGAWAVDVGGESTRPGAAPVLADVEMRRVLPVVAGLVASGVRVSIDTMKAPVAAAAVAAGASVVNDVSGGRFDPAILGVLAQHPDVSFVASHWRATSDCMALHARYDDVVHQVCSELSSALTAARAAGVRDHQLIVDPGIGFAKNADHNWKLLGALPALRLHLGCPVMIGTSRKRFLGAVVPDADQPAERDDLTAVTSALAAQAGAAYVRVHNVTATRRALAVAEMWLDAAQVDAR